MSSSRITRYSLAGALAAGLLAPATLPAAPTDAAAKPHTPVKAAATSKPLTSVKPVAAAAVKPSPAASTGTAKSTPASADGKQAWAAPEAAHPIPALKVPANTPPTSVINQVMVQHWKTANVVPAPVCDDRAFVRRIYLDLAGRIPTQQETSTFLAECAASRKSAGGTPVGGGVAPIHPSSVILHPSARTALVDRLLAGPEYAEHMRDVFDVVFMGRGNDGQAPRRRRRDGGNQGGGLRAQWLAYLEKGFAENRPWDHMVRDLVLARPQSSDDVGAVWYLYARRDKFQDMAESVSSGILGVQVQCAQCHNHFLVPEIKQKDYWGLVAFFSRSKNQDTKAGPRVAESAIGAFSNYATLAGQSFPAELTFFDKMVAEVRPAANTTEQDSPSLYRPKAQNASDDPAIPVFSRREQFADQVLKGNPLVARAAVNRFWELLVGRGFVHPVDKMDSRHEPSHPELLDWLAQDFERSGYDVKRLVRSIVLSQPYQLAVLPAPNNRPELFAAGLEKPLTAEQLYRSMMVAVSGKSDADDPELSKALVQIFPDLFAEESVSTLRQAMFLTNNPMFQKLTDVRPDTTAARLAAIADPTARVKEAFHVAYGREPDPIELKASIAYLKARTAEGPKATAQLWWALLSGAEFRFNH